MTLTLELTNEETERLEALAKAQGGDVAQVAHDVLTAHLPAKPPHPTAIAELMLKWNEEDATDDPEEIKRAEAEWKELEANLQANRLTLRIPEV